MATHDLPIEFILSRSLSEGIVKKDDPNLVSVRLSQCRANGLASFPSRPLKSNILNTINGSKKYSAHIDSIRFADHRHKSVSGYGLADSSSSEETDSDFSDRDDDDYSFVGKRSVATVSTTNTRASETKNTARKNRPMKPNSHVDYVAHITGRMDPWELQIQKLRDEGKVNNYKILIFKFASLSLLLVLCLSFYISFNCRNWHPTLRTKSRATSEDWEVTDTAPYIASHGTMKILRSV